MYPLACLDVTAVKIVFPISFAGTNAVNSGEQTTCFVFHVRRVHPSATVNFKSEPFANCGDRNFICR